MSRDKPNTRDATRPEEVRESDAAREYKGRVRASFHARVVRAAPGEYAAAITALDEGAGTLDVGPSILDVLGDLLVDVAREETK